MLIQISFLNNFLLSEEFLLALFARHVYGQNLFQFLFLWESLYFYFILKDNFWGYGILGWWCFFPFNILNISFYSPFTCMVFQRKLDVVLTYASPLKCFHLLVSANIFLLSLIFCSLNMIWLCVYYYCCYCCCSCFCCWYLFWLDWSELPGSVV